MDFDTYHLKAGEGQRMRTRRLGMAKISQERAALNQRKGAAELCTNELRRHPSVHFPV